MSAPDKIEWYTFRPGIVIPLIMGSYELAANPFTAMNALLASTPRGAPPQPATFDDSPPDPAKPITFLPGPGTFL